jgi:hypothetical protein
MWGRLAATVFLLATTGHAGGPPVDARATAAPALVDLAALDPTIRLDLRYATRDNVTGRALYRSARTARLGHEMLSLAQAFAVTAALAALGSYLVRGELSRLVILVFFFTAIGCFYVQRAILRAVQARETKLEQERKRRKPERPRHRERLAQRLVIDHQRHVDGELGKRAVSDRPYMLQPPAKLIDDRLCQRGITLLGTHEAEANQLGEQSRQYGPAAYPLMEQHLLLLSGQSQPLSTGAKKAVPISQAPAPISPVGGGSSTTSVPLDQVSLGEYVKRRNAVDQKKRTG